MKWLKWINKLSPKVANKVAVRLFFKPVRFKTPEREKAWLTTAEQYKINTPLGSLHCYKWPSKHENAPKLLLVHGWSGRASQMGFLAEKLQQAGYECYAFDAIGHGETAGAQSNMLLFSESISFILSHFKPFYAVIGHSIGGVAVHHALANGDFKLKWVTISSPADMITIVKTFADRIGLNLHTGKYLLNHIKYKYNINPYHIAGQYLIQLHNNTGLAIHDHDDKEVMLQELDKYKNAKTSINTYITHGLGHIRILRDEGIAQKIIAFIKDDSL